MRDALAHLSRRQIAAAALMLATGLALWATGVALLASSLHPIGAPL